MKNNRKYFSSLKIKKMISVFSLLLIVSCSGTIKINKNIPDTNERVKLFLDAQIQKDRLPGVQYVLFDQHEILYEYHGGLADVKMEKKIKPESLMNVFSTTKVITAIAILQLYEKQKLSLDDKIDKFVPDAPYKDITIRDVLSHSSGIPNPIMGNLYIHWADEHDTFDRDDLLHSVMKDNAKLKFKPGEKILYSNLGYAILGKIIENVSGLKYEDYVEEYIFKTLGLDSREINFDHQFQPNAARPYYKSTSIMYNLMVLLLENRKTKDEGKWKSIDKPFYFNFPSHGGIVASAREFSKIFINLLSSNPNLLTPDSLKMMFTEQRRYKDWAISVSWFKGNLSDEPYFYHQGGGMGYISEIRLYPEKKIGSVLLINRSDVDSLSLLNILDSEFISVSVEEFGKK